MPKTRYLSLTGIRPSGDIIGPLRNHLRWSLPVALGFPRNGFVIYRRPPAKPGVLEHPDLKTLATSPSVSQKGLTLALDGQGGFESGAVGNNVSAVLVNAPASQWVKLLFAEPLSYFTCSLGNTIGPVEVRAVSGNRLIEKKLTIHRQGTPSGQAEVEIRIVGLTEVDLKLPFRAIFDVAFQTVKSVLAEPNWERAAELPTLGPGQATEGRNRFEPDLKNYYARDQEAARRKYLPHVGRLLEWLESVTDVPAPLKITRQSIPDDGEMRGANIGVLSTLMLASLDPNVARILSLYWVDPKANAFDYKVRGIWTNTTIEGLALGVGAQAAPLPPAVPPSLAEDMIRFCWQMPGFSWRNLQPMGRMALRWREPPLPVISDLHAVQPVLYDVVRGDGAQLTRQHLALISGKAHDNRAHPFLIDTSVPMGRVAYDISGIDLFGQQGPRTRISGEARESLAPPPPIRLRCEINTTQTSLTGSFEFGAMQASQTPDVTGFDLMWRADSPIRRERVRIEIVSSNENDDGTFQQVVRVKTLSGQVFPRDDMKKFEGGVIEVVSNAVDGVMPASARHSWPIASVSGDGTTVLISSSEASPGGIRDLVSDCHHRANWKKVNIPLPATPPLSGRLIANASESWHVTAKNVERIELPRLPSFDVIPAAAKSARRPTTDTAADVDEIVIDCEVLDPSPWIGGRVVRNGVGVDILALLPPAVGGAGSRVRVDAHSGIVASDAIRLVAATGSPHEPVIRALQIDPDGSANDWLSCRGGELAFEVSGVGENKLAIARIVATPLLLGSRLNVVVRVPKNVVNALKTGLMVRCFPPYRFDLPISLTASAGGEIKLPLDGEAATRSGYLAVCAKRGSDPLKIGPLCAPMAFTVVRPAPAGAPSRPYPDAFGDHAPAGYATPPNAEGRSTVVLRWDVGDISPATALRHDVARALDTTIPTAHRRNWLRGLASHNAHLIQAGVSAAGGLSQVALDATTGVFKATFTPDVPPIPEVDFGSGRLEQGGNFFEITFAAKSDSNLRLLLRKTGQAPPANGAATVRAVPDYQQALQDVDELSSLAVENPDAFSLATGAPIAATTFRDEISGLGTGRFFYRVRAVDPAGNASAWSAVSVPFHQVDMTPPAKPIGLQASSGIKKVTLHWQLDLLADAYAVHRATSSATLASLAGRTPLAVVEAIGGVDRPLQVSFPDEPLELLGRGSTYAYRVIAMRSVRTGSAAADVVVVSSAPSDVVRAMPVDPEPPQPPNDLVSERATQAGASIIRLEWSAAARLEYLVRRRLETSSIWTAVSGWLADGEPSDVASGWNYNFIDEAPVPERTVYQVIIRNHAGRTAQSNEAGPI
jgi:hypothetical protein